MLHFVQQAESNNHLPKLITLLVIEKETPNVMMKSLVTDGLKRHNIFLCCNVSFRFELFLL